MLGDSSERLTTGSVRRPLGHSALELLRALIMSTTDDGPLRRTVSHESLLDRILTYTDLHCTDPALTPQRVAAAHHISLRTLYRVCGRAEISLEQEIITGRLQAIRRALENPANRHRTITALAFAHGFTNMTFFTRRFRQAYGRTPSEYRRASAATTSAATPP
jgi:AraC-like DNA-binding protein